MKITKLQTIYAGYAAQFFQVRPELAARPYAEQKKALDFDCFGWADFWGHAFRAQGHEMREYIANAEPMQKAWARENGIKVSQSNWLLEIARAQVIESKPEVLFLADYDVFKKEWIRELREDCPSIRLVAGYCGAPFSDATVFDAYDIVFSNIPELIEQFRVMGHDTQLLYHGFDARILERINAKAPQSIDFSFVGSVIRSNAFHLERERMLESLAGSVEIKIFSPSRELSRRDVAKYQAKIVGFGIVQSLLALGLKRETIATLPNLHRLAYLEEPPLFPVNRKLLRRMEPPRYGLAMYQVLHDSKVTFNNHINVSPRTANNMRLYEATGVGACLLTDWKENLPELFVPEKEVVTYRSMGECVDKARWLLSHPSERERIANAGQARTLRDHTWARRAHEMAAVLESRLAQG